MKSDLWMISTRQMIPTTTTAVSSDSGERSQSNQTTTTTATALHHPTQHPTHRQSLKCKIFT